jgi:hypothetical protein
MSWVWVLIPLVAIVGGLIVQYQENKMKMLERSQQNQDELGDVRSEMEQLRKRIENLEAIAANDPSGFEYTKSSPSRDNVIDEVEFKDENRSTVEDMARKNRTRS